MLPVAELPVQLGFHGRNQAAAGGWDESSVVGAQLQAGAPGSPLPRGAGCLPPVWAALGHLPGVPREKQGLILLG